MEINRYHELKTIQPFFNQVVKGEKHFELRKHDRDYQVGDFLLLVEYGEGIMFPTVPQSFLVKITSMVSSEFGLKDGYCALSIETDLFFRNHYNVLETKKKRKGVLDYSHNVDVFLDDIAGRYVGVDFEELKMSGYNQSEINKIATKYKTDYFVWIGIVHTDDQNAYAPKKMYEKHTKTINNEDETLFYIMVFDVKKAKLELATVNHFAAKDSKKLIKDYLDTAFADIQENP